MKYPQLIFISLLLTIPTLNYAQNKEYYPSGKLKAEYERMVNSQPDGLCKFYHENGQLARTGKAKAGKEEGLWKAYYANGVLGEEKTFVNGVIKMVTIAVFIMPIITWAKLWLNLRLLASMNLPPLLLAPTTVRIKASLMFGATIKRPINSPIESRLLCVGLG